MMEQSDVLTTWSVELDGAGVPGNTPTVAITYSLGYTDITGHPMDDGITPPDPNNYVLHVWGESTVIDAIEADPNYVILPGTRQPYSG